MLVYVMVGVTVVAVAGAFFAAATVRRRGNERLDALRQLAARMGWGFRDTVAFDAIPGLDRFELFTQGRQRTLSGIMTSPDGDPRIVVFDYSYVTGSGKSQATHRQTVCYLTSDQLALPTFSLRPEHFFHRIAGAFGYDDIDLERRQAFSDAFLLRGEDEVAVRDAFNDDVVDFFDQRTGTCSTGLGHELLFWRPGRRLPPDEREPLIAEGVDLVGRFTNSTSAGS